MIGTLDLTGVYRAEGKHQATGAKYGAEVTIAQLGEVYQLQWRSGPHVWIGVGVVQGDVLAVSLSGASQGVIAFEILPHLEHGIMLHGVWAYAGEMRLSTEVLYRKRGPGQPTRYNYPGSMEFMEN